MNWRRALTVALAAAAVAACQQAPAGCPLRDASDRFLTAAPPAASPTQVTDEGQALISVEIAGQTIRVNEVVTGPLCNGTWSGMVYVGCDVQVLPWDEQPTFLETCDLSIAPNTVVYVAYHNDTPYYNGCSCHTGEITGP